MKSILSPFALLLGTFLLCDVAPTRAMTVSQLELTGGDVEWRGQFGQKLERLFDQGGILTIGDYQPLPDIVTPITKGPRMFSLFTSGLQGAAPPSASVTGSSITVDLSSLFFGISRGDHLQAWNIGGVATGIFNPETAEFFITWEHIFSDRPRLGPVQFSLQGEAQLAAVPIVATPILFGTGLTALIGWLRMNGMRRKARPAGPHV